VPWPTSASNSDDSVSVLADDVAPPDFAVEVGA
jgi:hypothetical protein